MSEKTGYTMKTALVERARRRLDERLEKARIALDPDVPARGWVRAIRDALGMSGPQLARRMGVSAQSVDALERSEVSGSIKLETLRRAAEALDCRVVYVLIPNRPLENMVRDRARAIAVSELATVGHTMRLEDQAVPAQEREIDDFIAQHIRARDLWDDRP